MTDDQFTLEFRFASTPIQKADVIIKYLRSNGLDESQILDVIKSAKFLLQKLG